jgi:mRNA interferase MazF
VSAARSDEPVPARGEVWLAELSPTRGHEQAGTRPVLVVSTDGFNRGRARLALVVPLTTRDRGVRFHAPVEPPEGVRKPSLAMCEGVRSISTEKLIRRFGRVGLTTLATVEDRLRILLEL